jgi:glycosyltransferase involved in cell wall biosynthesis
LKNKLLPLSHVPRLRVAFFQRIFAHYQAGLVRELARNSEHEYHFFGDESDPMRSGIEPISAVLRNQVVFTACRTVHWGKYLAFQWRAVREALFGDFEVYIMEGSFTVFTNWLAIPVARIRGKRVLLYSHGWLRREFGCKAWLRIFFYRLADGLLLYGNRSRQIGILSGFLPARLYVVYNSLDMKIISRSRKSVSEFLCTKFRDDWFGSDAKNPLIVSVGRLTSTKEYPLLLDALSILQLQGMYINVMLVGEGPDLDLLKNKACDLGLNLILPGARYNEDFLSVCFSAADITVIPGAAGLTVIHSLSYGTPVIVHDDADCQMPESEAIESGINGALFHSGDANSLAHSIKMVLQKIPRSPHVANQCRSVVEAAYTPYRMRVVFDEAVNGRPAKSY